MNADDYDSIAAFVDDHRDALVRVLRHSSDPYARACAWTLLDAGSDAPELERLHDELDVVQEGSA